MNKEQLVKLAEGLELAGYKIEALNGSGKDFSDNWILEISPLKPFKAQN
jgi:hypothetical protein